MLIRNIHCILYSIMDLQPYLTKIFPIPIKKFIWITYIFFQFIFITDRLALNLWSRQSFSNESDPKNSKIGYDYPVRKIGDPWPGKELVSGNVTTNHATKQAETLTSIKTWTIPAFDVLIFITGRFIIVAFNYTFLTVCQSTWSYLDYGGISGNQSNNVIGNFLNNSLQKIINLSDCLNHLKTIHKNIALQLIIATLIHIYAIFLPAMSSQFKSVKIAPLGEFAFPLSERGIIGHLFILNDPESIYLLFDDVVKLILISLLFLVLFLTFKGPSVTS